MARRYKFSPQHLISICICLLFLNQLGMSQTQVVLGASKDNTLYESSTGSLSNGAGPGFFVGRTNQFSGSIRRGLIAFDIAGNIPAGATITSVTLTLSMSKSIAGAQTVELRRLLANWGEGTSNAGGGGAPATTGDATWLHTLFNTSFWATPGGVFSSNPSASQTVSGVGVYAWGSTTQMVSDVQGWLNNPTTNFGWLLLGNEATQPTSKRFETKESFSASARPRLTVVYSTVGVEEEKTLPQSFALHQNYPNPFNPSTKIRFQIPSSGYVTLEVFDAIGKRVATLVNGETKPGSYEATWDATGFASGVYFYRLHAAGFSASKRLLLIR